MTDTMINRITTAMQESPAWPAVFDAGTAETLARVALETVREPSDAMERAGNNVDLEYVYGSPTAWAHWCAMIDAALSETT